MIARAARAGAEVTVLTVFAGDPELNRPAGAWDLRCGFASAKEASRERRREDTRACEILGATPAWLPFPDEQYEGTVTAEDVWSALSPKLDDADLVLIPGYPLENYGHAWLAQLFNERMPAELPVALYVEQPYANLLTIGRGYRPAAFSRALAIALRTRTGLRAQTPAPALAGTTVPLEWVAAAAGRKLQDIKGEAILAYHSQIDQFGGRLVERIRLYEWGWGGEGIAIRRP
jgi:hypothetical protein